MGWPLLDKCLNPSRHVLQHLLREGRLNTNPEGVIHDDVGLGQFAADAKVLALHVGLTSEVAGEEQSAADFVLVEMTQQVDALNSGFGPYGNGETEPGRIGLGRGFGEDQPVLTTLEPLLEPGKVAFAGLDETFEPVHLGEAAGGLHVGNL